MEIKKQQLKKLKNERGLTLVELLAVIVILGIIGTIAFVMIGNVMDNAKKDAHIANAQQLIDSAKLYEASGNEISSEVDLKTLHEKDFIEDIVDPWTKNKLKDDDLTKSKVTKNENGEYSVVLMSSDNDHNINASEETLRTLDDRDDAFSDGE